MTGQLLIGSRGSALALAQANEIVKALGHLAPDVSCRVIPITTKGDMIHEKTQQSSENKSIFTKEIEDALLAGEIQLAVHSLKDLTTDLPSGLTIAAVPRRADHRDALVSRKKWHFQELPGGARVGTSSARRRTQLLAARSDLTIEEMRGRPARMMFPLRAAAKPANPARASRCWWNCTMGASGCLSARKRVSSLSHSRKMEVSAGAPRGAASFVPPTLPPECCA